MRKKSVITWLVCLMLSLSVGGFTACGILEKGNDSESVGVNEETSESSISSEAFSNVEESESSISSEAASDSEEDSSSEDIEVQHDYTLVEAVAGTCSAKGTVEHYFCEDCGKYFDLLKNEIESIESDYDLTNHASAEQLTLIEQPTKTVYKIGETFDPTGMYISYNCADCEGEILDNQFLTYTYKNGEAFVIGDTKIVVSYNGVSLEVDITVEKAQAVISGVEATYQTTCGVAPIIAAVSNYPDATIVVQYFDGETEIDPSAFVAGKTYTAKVSVAETETMLGAEAMAEITVSHNYEWKEDASDWKKLACVCVCGEEKPFYAMNYQSPYVAADKLDIDLSAFVFGAESVSVKSVKQVVRMKGDTYVSAVEGEVVDIDYTNDGTVYSFAADKYEQPSGEYKPYILTLSVTYDIDGMECTLYVEAKLVDKVITTAEELSVLAYTGKATANDGGVANTGYYVLGGDIDASEYAVPDSNHAWQEGIGFLGVFEGNGYTISNLTIGSWKNGLFGAMGINSKVQNVNFENVVMGTESSLFALAARKTQFTNVNVTFGLDTQSSWLANTMNECVFDNVAVKTYVGSDLFANLNDTPSTEIPDGITDTYYEQFTVTFNTNGGNEIMPVKVTIGKKVAQPENPTKAADEDYEYTFAGWFYGEEQFNFDTPITADIEIVAKWTATEKLNEDELIASVNTAIAELPNSVEMPRDFRYLAAIANANALYNQLSNAGKAEVTGAEKLANLLASSQGYTAIYTPDTNGVKAVPAALHNNNLEVGVTGAVSTDADKGTTFVSTADTNGKAAIQFINFPDVSQYDKIYFFVRSSISGYLYMADDGENGGWGSNWANNSGTITNYPITASVWTLMSVDVSTGIFADDWMMSVFNSDVINKTLEVGVIVGCKTAELPEVNKVEVNLNWGVRVDSGETNEYGKVYNLSREQWYIDNNDTATMGTLQKGALAAALPEGFDYFEFYIYNPTENDINFHLAGGTSAGWTDSEDFISLKAGQWTKVVISNADIQMNTEGVWYVYIGNSDAEGWKISTIYACK